VVPHSLVAREYAHGRSRKDARSAAKWQLVDGGMVADDDSWESVFDRPMAARTPSLGVNYLEALQPIKVGRYSW